MVNLILCGGSGTRLWPLSRKLYPKQFVPLINKRSLFQETIVRNSSFCKSYCHVTGRDLHFMAYDQTEDLNLSDYSGENFEYLLEPMGRNTAPAIAIACFNYDANKILLVTPSDHLIEDSEAYKKRVNEAIVAAEAGNLVTFGIKPDYPETGYGYIEASDLKDGLSNTYCVASFREKPDEATAKQYLAKGNYYWNSGMFVFKAGVFLEELKKYSPEIYAASQKAFQSISRRIDRGSTALFIPAQEMMAIPADSIDYAVMEKSDKVVVIPSEIGWNDLGSFDSLYDVLPKDKNGNTLGENHILIDSNNNLIVGSNRKIGTIGIEDSIIIDTDDALMISKRGSSQQVKELVDEIKKSPLTKQLAEVHRTAHRPWGTYTVLEESNNFKIKRIMVKPGQRLSLQKHMHRSEHWVVVTGTATVQINDTEQIVRPNESVYIKIADTHRLTNNGIVALNIIETQVGEYVGEDDIIRLEDDYQR